MRISDRGIGLIKRFEGCRLTAYGDSAGVMTIGYGHTGGVRRGDTITEDQAEEYLRRDVKVAETCISSAVTVPLNQNRFDALCSLVYNIGCGAFLRSSLRRKINLDPSDPSIRGEFIRWTHAGGRSLPGLERRRREEADLYFS